MGFLSTTSKLCSALILVAINCLLLAGGIIIVVASHHAKGTGWVDVIDTYWSSTDTVLNALQITGYVIIALAVLGSVAACCRWRLGLLVYAIVVFIVLIAFGAIAGVTFAARSTSQDWKGKTYPAADAETTIKVEFDKAYCLAQGEYLCNEISVSDAAAIFYPEFANSSVLSSFSSLKGINSMCSAFSTLVPSLTTVCKGCEAAKQFENFTDVLTWANDKCPRTSSTLLWCGNYFATSNDSLVTTGTAPYVHCRTEFLDLVSSSALTLGTGSIIIACGALLVLVFTCCLRRQERRDAGYENVEYGNTPHGVQNGTPQTQQPFVGTNTMHSKV